MKKKKLMGAIIPASLLMAYLIFILVFFIYSGVIEKNVPLPAFVVIIIGISLPLIGMIISMI